MTQTVTLRLADDLARSARHIAQIKQQRLEDVLTEWIERGIQESDLDLLPDGDILSLADSHLPADEQAELSDLLDKQRESRLSEGDRLRLDHLMAAYRQGLVRKAKALRIAVQRGLRPALSS